MARKHRAPRGTYTASSPRMSRGGRAFSGKFGASLGPFENERCRRCQYHLRAEDTKGYHAWCLVETALNYDCEPEDIDVSVHPPTQKQLGYLSDLIDRHAGQYTPRGTLIHRGLMTAISKSGCSRLIKEITGR